MLFWRRPVPMVLTLLLVEVTSALFRWGRLTFLSVLCVFLTFYIISRQLYHVFGDAIASALFPPIDEGEPTESNRIYPLLPFCQRFSHISSTIVDKLVEVNQSINSGSISTVVITATVFVVLFALTLLTGTFWVVWTIVHLVLLLPGIVMHPKVFPYAEPYILKFAEAIKCPYCHAKAE
jgi:hypothetical protein